MSDLFKLVMGGGFAFGFMSFFILYYLGYAIRIIVNIMRMD